MVRTPYSQKRLVKIAKMLKAERESTDPQKLRAKSNRHTVRRVARPPSVVLLRG